MKRSILFLSLLGFVAGSAFAADNTAPAADTAKAAPAEKVVCKPMAKKHHMAAGHHTGVMHHHMAKKGAAKSTAKAAGSKGMTSMAATAPVGNAVQVSNVEGLGKLPFVLNLSGGVAVDGQVGDKDANNFDSFGTLNDEDGRTLLINDAFLNADFIVDPNVSGRIGFEYAPEVSGGQSRPVLADTPEGLTVDQAFVNIHTNGSSVTTGTLAGASVMNGGAAVIGQQWLPFGTYNNATGTVHPMIIPFTQLVTSANDVAVKAVYEGNGFNADAYVFQDGTPIDNTTRRANFGADVGYDGTVGSGVTLAADLGYLDNWVNISSFGFMPFNVANNRSAAVAGYLMVGYEGFDANLHAFRSVEATANGAHPMTWDAQARYTFPVANYNSRVYVGYSRSSDFDTLPAGSTGNGMPLDRISLGYDFDLNANTTLGVEAARDTNYDNVSTNNQAVANSGESYYMGVARVAVHFG